MKTIFKIGMEVYDSLNYPNQKGEVVDIKECVSVVYSHPVIVKFDKVNVEYDKSGRLCGSLAKTLAIKPYEVNFNNFEQKPLPITLVEAERDLISKKGIKGIHLVKTDDEPKVYTSLEMYKAFEALKILVILRDYYNDYWQPNNIDNSHKYGIISLKEKLTVELYVSYSRVMFFSSVDIANKFLEDQKELLEIAKPLL